MPDDDESALGKLSRQEMLSVLMMFVFGAFAVTFSVIMIVIFSNPATSEKIVVTGDIDLSMFTDRFDELLMAFIALLGVAVGLKARTDRGRLSKSGTAPPEE